MKFLESSKDLSTPLLNFCPKDVVSRTVYANFIVVGLQFADFHLYELDFNATKVTQTI